MLGKKQRCGITCLPYGIIRSGMASAEASKEPLGLTAADLFPLGMVSFGTCRV